jgi:hypothetical protein
MRRTLFAIVVMALNACACGLGAASAHAQTQAPTHVPTHAPAYTALPADAAADATGAQTVDGIAARIEDDVLTESEVRELSAFQKLVDGRSKSRVEVIQELADQWIMRGEATTALFPLPSAEDVGRAYEQLGKQFGTPEEFAKRSAEAGLTESAIRRILEQQLYLSRFIGYRFRPAAQVDEKQIAAYYNDEFAAKLKARGETVPALEDVEDTIREVLIQRAISDRAAKWLDETRGRMKIDIVAEGVPK